MPLARLLGSLAFALGLALALPACDDGPSKKPPKAEGETSDSGEQAKIAEGRKKIDQATSAIGSKAFKKARKLLNEAKSLGVESQRFEIEEALEKLDKREAKVASQGASEKLAAKDCAGAVADLAAAIKEKESDAFAREVRHDAGPPAIKCMQAVIDDDVLQMKYADARKLVFSDDATSVLGEAAVKKLQGELSATIEESLKAQLGQDLVKRKWADAVAKVDGWVKHGDADDAQALHLLGYVRDTAKPDLMKEAAKGIGAPDGAKALASVDAAVKILRWELVNPNVAEIAKDKAMPDDMAAKYRALGTWVEATHVSFKALKKPEKRFAHGKISVFSPVKSDQDDKRDVPHGQEIWILGSGKTKALITDKDPGDGRLAELLEHAIGWVPTDRLAKEPTADWLPPDDQLQGVRVWGPLRPNEATYELGTVTEVSGKDIKVKRFADDQIFTMTRAKLRSGRLAPGTKVVTFCTAKDQPAQIVEVLATGSAKLKCDGGQEKEEVLASLRSKPELLPATK